MADSQKKTLPKAVQDALDALGDTPVTPQALKFKLTGQQITKASAAMRSAMSPAAKASYKALSTNDERHGYLAQFLLDPQVAKLNGFNTAFAFNTTRNDSAENWWTREELAGPKGLNSFKNADILIESNTLPTQPHENPALAAAGVLQYFWVTSSKHTSTGLTDKKNRS